MASPGASPGKIPSGLDPDHLGLGASGVVPSVAGPSGVGPTRTGPSETYVPAQNAQNGSTLLLPAGTKLTTHFANGSVTSLATHDSYAHCTTT